jgi:hypothetical protein
MDLQALNDLFNDQLRQQIAGTLPKEHVYEMGKPCTILSSAGVPDFPIQLKAQKLTEKAHEGYGHPFDLSDVKNLPKAIQNPLAVFSYGDKSKAVNLIVEVEKNEKKFLVGVALNPMVNGKSMDVHSIRTVFPKDTHEWVMWISQGKGMYFNKEKVLGLLVNRRHPADVTKTALNLSNSLESATNIVQNFQNPPLHR